MADSPAWPPRVRDPMARPLLWRLPLAVFVFVGLAAVANFDALLRRDVERDAERHAEQVQALLSAHLRDRASYVHALTLALAALNEAPGRAPSFLPLSRELQGGAQEVVSIALVDTMGRVREQLIRHAQADTLVPESRDAGSLERAVAVAGAVRQGRMTITPTVTLRDGSAGVIMYDPIVRAGRTLGLVGAGIAHRRLLDGAVTAHARFSHRVRDTGGEVITLDARWPTSPQRVVTRDVMLPDGRRWEVDIAVPRFEPFLPRLLTGLAGAALIALVVATVLREAGRSERLAEHSLRLELVSRDLLDANVRLEERAGQVVEANRAKSRFLANVSHELRTPINAIVGYNALALDGMYGSLPTSLREAHERIRLASRHLLALVDDVLDLSRIEAGRMSLEPGPVDPGALLASVAAVVEPTAAAKGVHIDVVLGRDLPRLVTDGRHLRQILINLASNAVKFTERGVITLVARRDPADPTERFLLAVEDTGVGILPADQVRVFEEFEQVLDDARGDSQRRGTGLGLPIARKLALLLGGDVEVDSTPGIGSRFTVRVPIVVPGRETTSPPIAGASPTPAASSAIPGTASGAAPRRSTTTPTPRVTTGELERAVARTRELVDGTARPDVASSKPTSMETPRGARVDASSGVDAPDADD